MADESKNALAPCPHVREQLEQEIAEKEGTIPLVDIKANYKSIQGEIDNEMSKVLASGWFIGGPVLKEFENSFASFCGDDLECIGVNSGTDSLVAALKVLGVGPGDEVITVGNTFIATCVAVSAVGADIVLVDCEADSYLMDVSAVEAAITERTKVLLPVHLYGQCVDMDPLLQLAAAHGLRVVEDACQAHGATYKGRRAGTMGDIGCFSFYPGKNLGAFGDGGAVVTGDAALAAAVRVWRNIGCAKKYHHTVKGANSRLDALQAAVLLAKLRHLSDWNSRRVTLAQRYSAQLAASVPQLQLPVTRSYGSPVWHLYVVACDERDALLKHLNRGGIGAGIHYPVPIVSQAAYPELLPQAASVPACVAAADRILSLPLYPELSFEQQDTVIAAIAAFFRSTSPSPAAAAAAAAGSAATPGAAVVPAAAAAPPAPTTATAAATAAAATSASLPPAAPAPEKTTE